MQKNKIKFPSPYGVTVIKSVIESAKLSGASRKFPSPYGVTVIKSEKVWFDQGQVICFRPLMG